MSSNNEEREVPTSSTNPLPADRADDFELSWADMANDVAMDGNGADLGADIIWTFKHTSIDLAIPMTVAQNGINSIVRAHPMDNYVTGRFHPKMRNRNKNHVENDCLKIVFSPTGEGSAINDLNMTGMTHAEMVNEIKSKALVLIDDDVLQSLEYISTSSIEVTYVTESGAHFVATDTGFIILRPVQLNYLNENFVANAFVRICVDINAADDDMTPLLLLRIKPIIEELKCIYAAFDYTHLRACWVEDKNLTAIQPLLENTFNTGFNSHAMRDHATKEAVIAFMTAPLTQETINEDGTLAEIEMRNRITLQDFLVNASKCIERTNVHASNVHDLETETTLESTEVASHVVDRATVGDVVASTPSAVKTKQPTIGRVRGTKNSETDRIEGNMFHGRKASSSTQPWNKDQTGHSIPSTSDKSFPKDHATEGSSNSSASFIDWNNVKHTVASATRLHDLFSCTTPPMYYYRFSNRCPFTHGVDLSERILHPYFNKITEILAIKPEQLYFDGIMLIISVTDVCYDNIHDDDKKYFQDITTSRGLSQTEIPAKVFHTIISILHHQPNLMGCYAINVLTNYICTPLQHKDNIKNHVEKYNVARSFLLNENMIADIKVMEQALKVSEPLDILKGSGFYDKAVSLMNSWVAERQSESVGNVLKHYCGEQLWHRYDCETVYEFVERIINGEITPSSEISKVIELIEAMSMQNIRGMLSVIHSLHGSQSMSQVHSFNRSNDLALSDTHATLRTLVKQLEAINRSHLQSSTADEINKMHQEISGLVVTLNGISSQINTPDARNFSPNVVQKEPFYSLRSNMTRPVGNSAPNFTQAPVPAIPKYNPHLDYTHNQGSQSARQKLHLHNNPNMPNSNNPAPSSYRDALSKFLSAKQLATLMDNVFLQSTPTQINLAKIESHQPFIIKQTNSFGSNTIDLRKLLKMLQ